MIAVTLAGGNIYHAMAKLASRLVEQHIGLPTQIIPCDELPRKERFRRKFDIFELVDKQHGTVFFFDADWFVFKPLDLQRFNNQPRLYACLDRQPARLTKIHKDVIQLQLHDKYFNTGFMILNRELHQPFFELCKKYTPQQLKLFDYTEQSVINWVAFCSGLTQLDIEYLDRNIYNFVSDGLPSKDLTTYHLCGFWGRKCHKLQLMKQILTDDISQGLIDNAVSILKGEHGV